MEGYGKNPLILPTRPRSRQRLGRLPRAVVEVGVPRGPGAVEGKGELLVVLVLLTPHPKGLEHLSAHGEEEGQRTESFIKPIRNTHTPTVRVDRAAQAGLRSAAKAVPAAVSLSANSTFSLDPKHSAGAGAALS